MINNGSILLVIIRIIDKLDFVILQALKLSFGKTQINIYVNENNQYKNKYKIFR